MKQNELTVIAKYGYSCINIICADSIEVRYIC